MKLQKVISYEGYLVDEDGNVFSDKYNRRRLLKYSFTKDGYAIITLCKHGISRRIRVNRLVALHFLKPIPGKDQVNHIDGDKLNNNYRNLEWVSCKENIKKAWELGLCKKRSGEDCARAKLSNLETEQIRLKYKEENITHKELSKIYNVTRQRITSIINHKR
jgi:hypothetical protein